MAAEPSAAVLVGVDGSEPGLRAVAWAAHVSARRQRPLRVVHGGRTEPAGRIVADAVAAARSAEPDLAVTGEVIDGDPVPVLLAEANRSAMVVLADRGRGGFTGLLVGSVAVQVCAHATVPVLVVRGETDRDLDVLVGIDGSPGTPDLLDFAAQEARLRGTGVVALHAFAHATASGPADLRVPYDPDQLEAEATEGLLEATAGWKERYPDVPLHRLVVPDRPARALIHAAERAGLVVIGSRGRGGFAGLRMGSVSHAVLHHASCPVAVIR
jgi:nucleotide-binding universal stress UspA family protein